MLLRSVPMRSGSQQCVKVVQGTRSFTAISTGQNRIGRRDSVHVLVHVRLRHYCLLLRHPAKLYWRAALLFCERYANPCIDVRLAATFQDLDSKSVASAAAVLSPILKRRKLRVLGIWSEGKGTVCLEEKWTAVLSHALGSKIVKQSSK